MRSLFRVVRFILILLIIVVLGFVIIVGPWPVYRSSGYQDAGYFKKGLSEEESSVQGEVDAAHGQLKAGWGVVEMTPKVGVPMAGYGARKGEKRSTGVHDPLFTKAVAFSDGKDTIIIVTADMLIVPPNVADLVRAEVTKRTGLPVDSIVFNASHTHCGPGSLGPGIAMKVVGGPFDPEVPPFIAGKMIDACTEAYNSMKPARLLRGAINAPQYIRNRAKGDDGQRPDVVDANLDYCYILQENGDEAVIARYSAHPTTYGSDMMQFSAEFPGAMVRHLQESRASLTAIYFGGGLGSMGPRAPEAPSPEERVDAMGAGLAGMIAAVLPAPKGAPEGMWRKVEENEWVTTADVAAAGFLMETPAFQIRPLENQSSIRLSPVARSIAGIPPEGSVSVARVGDWVIWGTPFDCSGEMSVRWRDWGKEQKLDVWTLSFNGSYLGYLSPDEYYWLEPLGYETGPMSWVGPDASAMMTEYLKHAVQVLTKS